MRCGREPRLHHNWPVVKSSVNIIVSRVSQHSVPARGPSLGGPYTSPSNPVSVPHVHHVPGCPLSMQWSGSWLPLHITPSCSLLLLVPVNTWRAGTTLSTLGILGTWLSTWPSAGCRERAAEWQGLEGAERSLGAPGGGSHPRRSSRELRWQPQRFGEAGDGC